MDFEVAFLIKLRRFNSAKQDEKLSLRELLNQSEYSAEDLTEEVWKYILQNPNKVLIIFDGFDEYSGKTKIDNESHPYRDNEHRGTQRQFSDNICSEEDLRSRIFGRSFPKFLACLPLLGFSNM